MVRSAAFALCVMAVAGAGCTGRGATGATAPLPTASSAPPSSVLATPSPAGPTSTVPTDPYAIPAVIDAAYVNSVLAALYKIDGDALREVLASRQVGPAQLDKIGQVFSSPQLEVKLEDLTLVLVEDRALFKDPPGDRRVAVESLAVTRPTCIVARVMSDFSDVVLNPPARDQSMIGLVVLVPASETIRARGINPTPWTIALARLIGRNDSPLEVSPCR